MILHNRQLAVFDLVKAKVEAGLLAKLYERYTDPNTLLAISTLLEFAAEAKVNCNLVGGFFYRHGIAAKVIEHCHGSVAAFDAHSRKHLLATLFSNSNADTFNDFVQMLAGLPRVVEIKDKNDLVVLECIAKNSPDVDHDLTYFSSIKTFGAAVLRECYQNGFRRLPPLGYSSFFGDPHCRPDATAGKINLPALGQGHYLDPDEWKSQVPNIDRIYSDQGSGLDRRRDHPQLDWLCFFARLAQAPRWKQVGDILSRLAKLAPATVIALRGRLYRDGHSIHIETLLEACEKLIDDPQWIILLSDHISTEALMAVLDHAIYFNSLKQPIPWTQWLANPDQATRTVYEHRLQYYQTKYPEKPLAKVRAEFLAVEASLGISAQDLDAAIAAYTQILDRHTPLLAFDKSELQARIQAAALAPDLIEILTLGREVIRREFGIMPYNTQVITVLLLLMHPEKYTQGRVAQVQTGEGKSLIFCLLAMVLSMHGQGVDIITSNDYLARRDATLFAPLYRWFGKWAIAFSSGSWRDATSQQSDIRYAPSTHFRWAAMQAAMAGQTVFKYPSAVALIDEVDNLVIDEGQTAAISSAAGESFMPSHFFKMIFDFQKGDAPLSLDTLRQRLRVQIRMQHLRLGTNTAVTDLPDVILRYYLHRAQCALEMEDGKDYLAISDDDSGKSSIVIIDRDNTGRLLYGHVWTEGLHRFLEIKHFGRCKSEERSINSHYSAHVFFRRYPKIYALTGTLGGPVEHYELQSEYGLNCFAVPPHQPCVRRDTEMIIVNSDENLNQQVDAYWKPGKHTGKHHPSVLLMFPTVSAARKYYFKGRYADYPYRSELVTGIWSREGESFNLETKAVTAAGKQAALTITTPMFGRGTDIVPSAEAIAVGGLVSVQAFLAKNLRVEMQGRGRAGRQGMPGKSYVVASLQSDPTLKKLGQACNILERHFGGAWIHEPVAVQVLLKARDAETLLAFAERQGRMAFDECLMAAQETYFALMHQGKTRLETQHQVTPHAISRNMWNGQMIYSRHDATQNKMCRAQEDWGRHLTQFMLYFSAHDHQSEGGTVNNSVELDTDLSVLLSQIFSDPGETAPSCQANTDLLQHYQTHFSNLQQRNHARQQLLDRLNREILTPALAQVEATLSG